MSLSIRQQPLRLVVLISGNGSNLQAIIDSISQSHIPAQIAAVFSNNPEAFGLERAQQAGIPTQVINHRDYDSREAYDQALMQAIDDCEPELLVLAGFMRILSDEFVNHYLGKMINIHPSLLPKYKGLHTHQRALEAGDTEHGCSVHYVTPQLDDGPVILQSAVPVLPGDTVESLSNRVHEQEHIIYPMAIKWIAEGQVAFQDGELVSRIPELEQHILTSEE